MSLENYVDEKYLICEKRVTQSIEEELPELHSDLNTIVWSDRYVLKQTQRDKYYWDLIIFDLFMNESRQVTFRKSINEHGNIKVFLLENEFGLVVEQFFGTHYVSFVKTDWSLGEFKAIDKFERECLLLRILMDPLKPAKFIVRTQNGWNDTSFLYQLCTVAGSKFQFSKKYKSATKLHQYSNGKIFGFEREEEKVLITTYDWVTKQEQISEIDYVPERFDFICGNGRVEDEARQDELNAVFYCESENIGYYDLNWCYIGARFFDDNFIVNTRVENRNDDGMRESVLKVFSIPIRRPHSLRKSAWILLVKMMKRQGKRDPYEAAKKYLPLNTDLRSPWFEDTESDAESS